MGRFHFLWNNESEVMTHFIQTILFILVITFFRYLIIRALRFGDFKLTDDQRVKSIFYVRQFFLLVMAFGVLYIWAEMGSSLLSVSALFVAFVIANKETLTCVHGTFIKFRSNAYSTGDRIEVHGIRGDVLEVGLLSSTLMELGADEDSREHTGRTVMIPHSLYTIHPIYNESYLEKFYMHAITIPLNRTDDWRRAKEILLKLANEESAMFAQDVRDLAKKMARERGTRFVSVEPNVSLSIPEPDRIILTLRLPSPTRFKGNLEQIIMARFLEEFDR